MMSILAWVEGLRLSTWIRESDSVFAYAGVLFLHTLGLGMLVGTNVLIDLAVLRRRADAPLSALATFYPFMWAGFWLNVVSGSLLLIADATTKLTNPVFFIKMAFVGMAVLNMRAIRRHVSHAAVAAAAVSTGGHPLPGREPARSPFGKWRPATGEAGLQGLVWCSFLFWTAAITAGRLMAYLGPVSGAPDLAK